MITPSDDPEDAINETVGMNNREFCANLERAIEALSSDLHNE